MSELLNLGRMARRLGVTQQWLRDQADTGKVPCLRAGKRLLFNPVAVQETLAAQAANPRPDVASNDNGCKPTDGRVSTPDPGGQSQQTRLDGLDFSGAAGGWYGN